MRKLAIAAACCLASTLFAGEPAAKLGQPLTLAKPQTVRGILAKPDALVGKTVQVRGRVTEVCQMAGCWMALGDLETSQVLRVKVNDGEIVFPESSVGRVAVAEGKFAKLSLTREQTIASAKHEAEEQGRKFDPASIKSGSVIYQLQGQGAVIEE